MLPKTLNGWITLAVGLGLAVMPAYMATTGEHVPLWAILLNAALAYLGLYLRGGAPGAEKIPKPPAAAVVLLLVGGIAASGCSNAAGYRGLTAAVQTANAVGKAMAKACKFKRLGCVKRLGTADKAALRECLGDCPAALKHWVQIVKPAVGTGAVVTFAALEAARDKRACDASAPDCKDWIAKLKPWGCVLIRAVTLWRDLIPATAARYLGLLAGVEGMVCHD